MLTHDEIRAAIIATLQADTTLAADVKKWLTYLLNTGKITYPAIYVGTITQPYEGSCGSDDQYTSIADPMKITVGVMQNFHVGTAATLGTLYEIVYDTLKASPTVGLNNFQIHSISPITTKPMPKCGRAVIRAEMTLNATYEE